MTGDNDDAALMRRHKSSNFTVLCSHCQNWPTSCRDSIELTWDDQALELRPQRYPMNIWHRQ